MCLWVVIVTVFWSGSDSLSFMTTLPLWLCCLISALPAFLAWIIFGSRLALLGVLVWVGYGIIITDFLPPLSRIGMDYYQMPPIPDNNQYRIITLYSDCSSELPWDQTTKYRPDIVFIQGSASYNHTLRFASHVFGGKARLAQIGNCAVVVRDGQLSTGRNIADTSGIIVDWLPAEGAVPIRLISLSLDPVHYDMRYDLYSPSCWKYYKNIRLTHRKQLRNLFDTMREIGTQIGECPTILAGNFSASPQSPIFEKFSKKYIDCFYERGSGYGATYPVENPSVRLDRVFCSPPLQAARATTVQLQNTVRRSVIADVSLP